MPEPSPLAKTERPASNLTRLVRAAKRLEEHCTGVPLTCDTGGARGPMVTFRCDSTEHAHHVLASLIELANAIKEIDV
jgi:hypothetical protein